MLYLGGGGSSSDESQLWDRVFDPAHPKITMWPYAQPSHRHESILLWISSSLAPRGDFQISVSYDLTETDVLAIPGGNTFDLLSYIRTHSLDEALRSFVERGGKVYGGSAGALIFGSDIAICDVKNGGEDENSIGLEDTRGFDMCRGYVVSPHMMDEKEKERCKQWAVDNRVGVIGIPENGGVVISPGATAKSTGPGIVFVFTADGEVKHYENDCSWLLNGDIRRDAERF